MVHAQYNTSIRSGRPSQSIGAGTVGAQVFQMQTGYRYNQRSTDDADLDIVTHGTVLRLGLLERLEVSTQIDWTTTSSEPSDTQQGGLRNLHIGARYHLLDNDGWVPALAVQGRAILPVQSAPYQTDHVGSSWVLSSSHDLGGGFGLVTNWGASWAGDGGDATYRYIINLDYAITDALNVFAEVYGPLDDFETYVDGGLFVRLNPDLQVGLTGGWQGQDGIDDWFVDGGLSWRVDWRERVHTSQYHLDTASKVSEPSLPLSSE